MDIIFGTYDAEKDLGLSLLDVDIGSPDVKEELIDIPGSNGVIDHTEATTGYPTYKNVKHKLTFDFVNKNYQVWQSQAGYIKDLLHGKKMRVYFGEGSWYYYGRISVASEKVNSKYGKLEIELDAYPYRISDKSSLEPWLWDPFNFETDYVTEAFADVVINGTREVKVVGSAMPVEPVFVCSSPMTVTFNGGTYSLPAGRSSTPDIQILQGDNIFTFSGTGTVSIEFYSGRF